MVKTKTDIAKFKVLSDMENSPYAIAKRMDCDAKTVRKYLRSDVYQDEELKYIIQTIKEKETQELYLLGVKAKAVLHKYLDEILDEQREINPIPVIAAIDRTFQQRQLLEGKPTHQINVYSTVKNLETQSTKVKAILDKLEEEP